MCNAIRITEGDGGWRGPLAITPTEKCHTVLSVTGGGVHPVAQRIADLTGGVALDGFKTTLPDDEIMVAVVDCGGTARCGVYPKKKVYTVNLMPVGQSGPLAQFIKPEIYVSAVTERISKSSARQQRRPPQQRPRQKSRKTKVPRPKIRLRKRSARQTKAKNRTSSLRSARLSAQSSVSSSRQAARRSK